MIYYLSRNYKEVSSAGNKAKTDIEQIMVSLGYKNAGFKQTRYRNTILAFFMTLLSVLKAPFSLRKGDVLVLQYPLKKYFQFVCHMSHWRGAKVVVIIHDLGSFRRKKLSAAQEIIRLNHADYVIAHNFKMKNWLLENGCTAQLGVLHIFDYLSSGKSQNLMKPEGSIRHILYAGALNQRKNSFLYEVGSYMNMHRFSLYGSGFECDKAKNQDRFDYKGFVSSDELIAKASGDFGLVWDGHSVSSCTGDFGTYLQYNNPHKTSLYIRCGLPVIIWDKAALATFVSEEQIGISVSSLEELDEKLACLTEDEYSMMRSNVQKISDRLADGYYCKSALEEAVRSLFLKPSV